MHVRGGWTYKRVKCTVRERWGCDITMPLRLDEVQSFTVKILGRFHTRGTVTTIRPCFYSPLFVFSLWQPPLYKQLSIHLNLWVFPYEPGQVLFLKFQSFEHPDKFNKNILKIIHTNVFTLEIVSNRWMLDFWKYRFQTSSRSFTINSRIFFLIWKDFLAPIFLLNFTGNRTQFSCKSLVCVCTRDSVLRR